MNHDLAKRDFVNTAKQNYLLHMPFYCRAEQYPHQIALIYEGQKITYDELKKYVQKIAGELWENGVKPNDRVIVTLPRGLEQIAVILAIVSVGAAYVPIGCKQPRERKKKIIEDIKPKMIIETMDFMKNSSSYEQMINIGDDNTAYIIYTSGSTGIPKGVEISHRAAKNTIDEVIRRWNITEKDCILNVSSIDFDLSVFDIFGMLAVGGTIVLIPEEDYSNPQKWKDLIGLYHVTVWNSAPALLEMLATITYEKERLLSLRLALVSGDWISLKLPLKWYNISKENSLFVSLGGATEASIWSNAYEVDAVKEHWNSIPYGKPLIGQYYKIVDEKGEDCLPLQAGELLIGGKGLAKGYVNSPDLTKQKFIIDKSGERLYKTGDLGRLLEDGNIEFLGRKDNQVKIRGHRIELGEVEAALNGYSGVKKAIAVARGDKFNKYLAAYYTGDICDKKVIIDYLKIFLPEYSIPHLIYHIEEFPLTANGKIDREAVKGLLEKDFSQETDLSESLKRIKDIWEEIFEGRQLSITDNLFYQGADSLHVTRFVERIQRKYGVAVSLKKVFASQTIQELDKEIGVELLNAEDTWIEEGEI